jgi:hypothetical protein
MQFSKLSPIVSFTAALFLMIAPEPARHSPSNLADQPAADKPAANKDSKLPAPKPAQQ